MAGDVFSRPERRVDGPAKVTGRARYTADRAAPDALHLRYRFSPVAHGVVRSIDTSAAERMPGVRAILTGADCHGLRVGRRLQDWPLLAWDRVRFIGDRVAAVAAETEDEAEAAAAAIEVDIDSLPALLDPQSALAPDAPPIHPDAGGYVYLGAARPAVSHPNLQAELTVGRGAAEHDPAAFAARFAGPNRVFEHAFRTGRQHQAALEPHGALVRTEPDGRAHVTTTNKQPFGLRGQMASALDMPPELIEVDSTVIGGDFGGKGTSIDEYLCLLLSRRTGRPVRTTARFAEELAAYAPRHGGEIRLRTAVDADGRTLAHDADFLFDGGAYAAAKPLPELILPGALDVLAPYDIADVRIRVRVAYTNTVPGGHMRCPGELQAAFAGESHVDMIAAALGLEPLAFRRRNAVRPGSISAHHERIRVPRAAEVIDELARHAPAALPAGSGYGVAVVARRLEGGRQQISARIAGGRVELLTGLPDQGSGVESVIVRVAAAVLGRGEDGIDVRRATTATATPDLGVGASRVTLLVSRATEDAARQLLAALEAIAAERGPERGPAATTGAARLAGDAFVSPAGDLLASWDDVVAIAEARGVAVTGTYDSTADLGQGVADFTFAGLGVTVAVDAETGSVRLSDPVLVADTGTVINPVAHAGQIDGGFAMGLGAALMEELTFEDGQVQTLSLAEYCLPAAGDVPALRTVLLPVSPGSGAFGAKMAGEISPSCVAPAIANGIARAVGARVRTIPMTPERILREIGSPTG